MASKTLVVLGVLWATLLLLSSEVAARELTKLSEEKVSDAGAVEQKHGGGGYGPNYRGGGTTSDVSIPRGRIPHIPDPPITLHHNCPYSSCCKRNLVGHCELCCETADEKPDTKYPPGLHN